MLDAALEVSGFDAAMVVLEETGGPATVATRGLTAEEAAHPPSSGAGGSLPPGPITVSYRYGAADAADTHLIRGGLFVPLVSRDGNALGKSSNADTYTTPLNGTGCFVVTVPLTKPLTSDPKVVVFAGSDYQALK